MKILIAYFTQTGNTERIARAIHSAISSAHETSIQKISDPQPASLDGFNLIFIGSPCHAGTLAAPVRDLLSVLPEKPEYHLAGFITHASSAYNKSDFENCMTYFSSLAKKKEIAYHGCFECQGRLAPQLHEFIKKSKRIPDDEWNRMVAAMNRHPDEQDESGAGEFALRVISESGNK